MAIVQRKLEEAPLPGENARAVAGHNNPPIEDQARAAFREALLADRPDFELKLADIIAAAGRAQVANDDDYGRAGSYIKTARAAKQHIEAAHKTAKEPFLHGGRIVDGEKNTMLDKLYQAAGSVQILMNIYAAKKAAIEQAERERILAEQRAAAARAAQAERERIAAEQEAARAAAEAPNQAERDAAVEMSRKAAEAAQEAIAEASLAPVAPTRAEPVRSDDGATVSTKTVWNVRVDAYDKAFKAVKDDAKVREAIDAAVARLVRAGKRELPGCTVWPTQQAVAR